MLILVLLDLVILGIAFLVITQLPYPFMADNVALSIKDYKEVQEYVITDYIKSSEINDLDFDKKYHINKDSGKLILKEGEGRVNISPTGYNLNNFSLGKRSFIMFDRIDEKLKVTTKIGEREFSYFK